MNHSFVLYIIHTVYDSYAMSTGIQKVNTDTHTQINDINNHVSKTKQPNIT